MSVISAENRLANPAPEIASSGVASLWSLYTLTLRQQRHGKRWLVMAVLMLMPAALVVVLRSVQTRVPGLGLEFVFVFMLIPQALLPLVALIYASGIIQDEVEEQTITYLLIRPIARWQLYLVKLAATLTVAIMVTAIFTSLTYVAIYFHKSDTPEDVLWRCTVASCIHSLAVVAYCCIFGLISLITRRTLVIGILYIVIFEGLFANLAFGIRLITVIYYARIFAFRLLSFVAPTPEGPENIAADAWQLDVKSDPALREHPHALTCLAVLLLGSAACAAVGALLCSRREFHVKTPEKG